MDFPSSLHLRLIRWESHCGSFSAKKLCLQTETETVVSKILPDQFTFDWMLDIKQRWQLLWTKGPSHDVLQNVLVLPKMFTKTKFTKRIALIFFFTFSYSCSFLFAGPTFFSPPNTHSSHLWMCAHLKRLRVSTWMWGRGSHGLSAEGIKSRGPNGPRPEAGARRTPRFLVHYTFTWQCRAPEVQIFPQPQYEA